MARLQAAAEVARVMAQTVSGHPDPANFRRDISGRSAAAK